MYFLRITLLVIILPLALANLSDGESIPASIVLKQIERGEPVIYDNVTVEGNLTTMKLENLSIISPIIIRNSYINGTVNFEKRRFMNEFEINGTKIQDNADFSGSQFNKDAYFIDSIFSQNADFRGASFRGNVFFWGTLFNKTADFSASDFSGHTSFWKSQFKGYAAFFKSYFKRTVDFSKSKFNDDSYFMDTQFNGIIDFRWSAFDRNVSFEMAQFNDTAKYNGSKFLGNTYFKRGQFNNSANFDKVLFLKDADLSNSKFLKDASFEETQFNGYASFLGSAFSSNGNFLGARFDKDADFIESKFDGTAEFSCSRFTRDSDFLVTWNNIRDHLNCSDPVYQVLIRSFKNSGLFDEADDCYYERMEHLSASSTVDLAFKKLFWISCGYGVRPGYAIYLSIMLIVIFGLAYWIGDGIKRSKEPVTSDRDYPSPKEVVLGICQQHHRIGFARLKHFLDRFKIILYSPGRLLDLLRTRINLHFNTRRSISLGDALYFSSLVFFVALPPPAWGIRGYWRYIIILEDVLGWLLMTILVVALSNVIIR